MTHRDGELLGQGAPQAQPEPGQRVPPVPPDDFRDADSGRQPAHDDRGEDEPTRGSRKLTECTHLPAQVSVQPGPRLTATKSRGGRTFPTSFGQPRFETVSLWAPRALTPFKGGKSSSGEHVEPSGGFGPDRRRRYSSQGDRADATHIEESGVMDSAMSVALRRGWGADVALARSWGARRRQATAMRFTAGVIAALVVVATGGVARSASAAMGGLKVSVIVRTFSGADAQAERTVRELGGTVGMRLGCIDGFSASVPSSALPTLQTTPGVVSVTPNAHLLPETSNYDPSADVNSM